MGRIIAGQFCVHKVWELVRLILLGCGLLLWISGCWLGGCRLAVPWRTHTAFGAGRSPAAQRQGLENRQALLLHAVKIADGPVRDDTAIVNHQYGFCCLIVQAHHVPSVGALFPLVLVVAAGTS